MEPGDILTRNRNVSPNDTVDKSVMVYSLQYDSQTDYLPTPVTYVATPGLLCIIEL